MGPFCPAKKMKSPGPATSLSPSLTLRRGPNGKEIKMKAKMMAAVAAVCLSGLALAGCNQQQASNAPKSDQPAAGQASAPAAQAADISPESNEKFLADNAKK